MMENVTLISLYFLSFLFLALWILDALFAFQYLQSLVCFFFNLIYHHSLWDIWSKPNYIRAGSSCSNIDRYDTVFSLPPYKIMCGMRIWFSHHFSLFEACRTLAFRGHHVFCFFIWQEWIFHIQICSLFFLCCLWELK